jgi:EAL domain-containing protein (putative c-di-GMP-specific phosphodiesterase class I)
MECSGAEPIGKVAPIPWLDDCSAIEVPLPDSSGESPSRLGGEEGKAGAILEAAWLRQLRHPEDSASKALSVLMEASRHGNTVAAAKARLCYLVPVLRQDGHAEARSEVETLLKGFVAAGDKVRAFHARYVLALEFPMDSGSAPARQEDLGVAADFFRSVGMPFYLFLAEAGLGMIAWASGKVEEALGHLVRCFGPARDSRLPECEALALMPLAPGLKGRAAIEEVVGLFSEPITIMEQSVDVVLSAGATLDHVLRKSVPALRMNTARYGHLTWYHGSMPPPTSAGLVEKQRSRGLDLRLSVNVSTRDLFGPSVLPRASSICRKMGCDPDWLCLEVTETRVMEAPVTAIGRLKELKAAGFRISVGDFGTGYSLLSYLKKMPIDEMKIDRSFVTNGAASHEGTRLLESIVDLGRRMGLQVVAEGIERETELQSVRSLGCDYTQGWLIAKPMGSADFPAWFAVNQGISGSLPLGPMSRRWTDSGRRIANPSWPPAGRLAAGHLA